MDNRISVMKYGLVCEAALIRLTQRSSEPAFSVIGNLRPNLYIGTANVWLGNYKNYKLLCPNHCLPCLAKSLSIAFTTQSLNCLDRECCSSSLTAVQLSCSESKLCNSKPLIDVSSRLRSEAGLVCTSCGAYILSAMMYALCDYYYRCSCSGWHTHVVIWFTYQLALWLLCPSPSTIHPKYGSAYNPTFTSCQGVIS